MVRRFMLAAVVALSAVLFAAPVALAQYGDDYGSGSENGAADSGAATSSETSSDSGAESTGSEACPAKPEAGSTILNGSMDGKVEVPPGDADGTGQATFWLKDDKVWFKMSWEGIDKPNLAHIHKGAAGKAGEPVVTLFQGAPAKDGCVVADAAVVSRISANPGNYYVNVHNEPHPKGAIRAQLAAGESPTLPFTGDASQQLLWIGAAVTVAGMLLVYASRRYGIRVGRHLAPSTGTSRSASRSHSRAASSQRSPSRRAPRWTDDNLPW